MIKTGDIVAHTNFEWVHYKKLGVVITNYEPRGCLIFFEDGSIGCCRDKDLEVLNESR